MYARRHPVFDHQNTVTTLEEFLFYFSIASQHDLDIGHQGHLDTNKCNDTQLMRP